MRVMLLAMLILTVSEAARGAAPHVSWRDKQRVILDGVDYSYVNYAFAFSPDSKTLATGGRPYSLRYWNVQRGKLISDFWCDEQYKVPSISSLAYSPDGKTLAMGGNLSDDITLWDVRTQTPRMVFHGHDSEVCSVKFSPNGRLLASACTAGTVKLWDLKTNKLRQTLVSSMGAYRCVFSPDGKIVAAAVRTEKHESAVHLWNSETGVFLRSLDGYKTYVRNIVIANDNETLAANCQDGTVVVWNLKTGKELKRFKSGIFMVMTKNGKHIISVAGDNLEVWDVAKAERIGKVPHRLRSHPVNMALSPDEKTFGMVLDNSQIILWDVPTLLHRSR